MRDQIPQGPNQVGHHGAKPSAEDNERGRRSMFPQLVSRLEALLYGRITRQSRMWVDQQARDDLADLVTVCCVHRVSRAMR